jgi:hypothetical protein
VGAPVGGAPSRLTSTSAGSWCTQTRPDGSELSGAPKQVPSKCQVGAKQVPSRCRAGAEAASSQNEAMSSSREMRGPPSGRAQEGRRAPDKINGPRPPESKAFCGWF